MTQWTIKIFRCIRVGISRCSRICSWIFSIFTTLYVLVEVWPAYFCISRIENILEPYSMCGVPSTLIIFTKTHALLVYQVNIIMIGTTGNCTICTFILFPFIYFATLWPSLLSFVLVLIISSSSVIFSLLFICFNPRLILLDFNSLNPWLSPQLPHRFACSWMNQSFEVKIEP